MSTQNKDIRTMGIILKRTNYGEFDRIINIITPVGKLSAIAKGVRKERSKLAFGIELFSLAEYNLHYGKKELGIVTSVRLKSFYKAMITRYDYMELGGAILKAVNRVSEHINNPDFFEITRQCFEALDKGAKAELVGVWFWMNIAKASGDEVNLAMDSDGNKLVEGATYEWDDTENCFLKKVGGRFDTDRIKMLRLLVTFNLETMQKVKVSDDVFRDVLDFTKKMMYN